MNLLKNINKDIKNRFGDESKIVYKILDLYNSKPIYLYTEARFDDRYRFTIRVMTNENGILSYNKIYIAYNPNTNKFSHVFGMRG